MSLALAQAKQFSPDSGEPGWSGNKKPPPFLMRVKKRKKELIEFKNVLEMFHI
jgi:hypothetical protein